MSGRARTLFLGSGTFAIPLVEALAEQRRVELVAVVTAPAKPRGRRARVQPSPVAEWAAGKSLPTLTPERLRAPDSVAQIHELEPELLLLADYGQIVPRALLDLPRHGALNVHPSLLPRHRGASPVAAAILAGDRETGVTLMLMDEGLDSGPIVAQRRIPLQGTETRLELEQRLAHEGVQLLRESLDRWLAGDLAATEQAPEGVTLTRPLRREDGRLDPARSAVELERQVRAYQPWPGSFVETEGGRLTVWRARALQGNAEPGTLVETRGARGSGLALASADGLLELLELQPAGGRRMSAQELLRGRPRLLGTRAAGGLSAGSGDRR